MTGEKALLREFTAVGDPGAAWWNPQCCPEFSSHSFPASNVLCCGEEVDTAIFCPMLFMIYFASLKVAMWQLWISLEEMN